MVGEANRGFDMEWVIAFAAIVVGGGVVGMFATPRSVRYSESVEIAAPMAAIYDHIRFQSRLMRWSAWPSETGSTCAVECPDGTIGARTVFFTKSGTRFGYQEVIALAPADRVELKLTSKGPPQRPHLIFELTPLTVDRTRVVLHFENEITRPFNLLLRLFGVVRWTRAMHRKDLAGLKRYAEPPHRTYTGELAQETLAT